MKSKVKVIEFEKLESLIKLPVVISKAVWDQHIDYIKNKNIIKTKTNIVRLGKILQGMYINFSKNSDSNSIQYEIDTKLRKRATVKAVIKNDSGVITVMLPEENESL